ncbi:MAG TPA: hypothetical protein VH740_15895 [Vicinamibacterales bacterium]|jgi:hypothetical protein
MTADDFRRLALDMQGVVERAHMGHPDFRANGRIFASIHSNDRFGMVALEPAEQRELMKAHPKLFEPSAGAWGRQGATNVRLDARSGGDEAAVRGALLLAWTHVMAKRPPRKRAAGSPRSRKTSKRR